MVQRDAKTAGTLCLLALVLTALIARAETEQEHQARYMKYMRQEYTFYGWALVSEDAAQQRFTHPLDATGAAANPGASLPSGPRGLQYLQITYQAKTDGHVYAYGTFTPTPSKEMATQIQAIADSASAKSRAATRQARSKEQ